MWTPNAYGQSLISRTLGYHAASGNGDNALETLCALGGLHFENHCAMPVVLLRSPSVGARG